MPIAANSAPNNGRVKEAKVSSCTQGTGKALNGKVKKKMIKRMLKGELIAKLGKLNIKLKEEIRERIMMML